jgi:hypothetical protein
MGTARSKCMFILLHSLTSALASPRRRAARSASTLSWRNSSLARTERRPSTPSTRHAAAIASLLEAGSEIRSSKPRRASPRAAASTVPTAQSPSVPHWRPNNCMSLALIDNTSSIPFAIAHRTLCSGSWARAYPLPPCIAMGLRQSCIQKSMKRNVNLNFSQHRSGLH